VAFPGVIAGQIGCLKQVGVELAVEDFETESETFVGVGQPPHLDFGGMKSTPLVSQVCQSKQWVGCQQSVVSKELVTDFVGEYLLLVEARE
jgi:hypothetical protein